jgi:hypothetical protein
MFRMLALLASAAVLVTFAIAATNTPSRAVFLIAEGGKPVRLPQIDPFCATTSVCARSVTAKPCRDVPAIKLRPKQAEITVHATPAWWSSAVAQFGPTDRIGSTNIRSRKGFGRLRVTDATNMLLVTVYFHTGSASFQACISWN